jgi:hypothetical protein
MENPAVGGSTQHGHGLAREIRWSSSAFPNASRLASSRDWGSTLLDSSFNIFWHGDSGKRRNRAFSWFGQEPTAPDGPIVVAGILLQFPANPVESFDTV